MITPFKKPAFIIIVLLRLVYFQVMLPIGLLILPKGEVYGAGDEGALLGGPRDQSPQGLPGCSFVQRRSDKLPSAHIGILSNFSNEQTNIYLELDIFSFFSFFSLFFWGRVGGLSLILPLFL